MTAGSLRIGLLGGTLDPIHLGHLDAAEAARTALLLDGIIVIPSHDPPHRPIDPHASPFHRFAMVSLAIDGRPGYRAPDLRARVGCGIHIVDAQTAAVSSTAIRARLAAGGTIEGMVPPPVARHIA